MVMFLFADPRIIVTSMLQSDNISFHKIAFQIIKKSKVPQPPRLKTLKGLKKFHILQQDLDAEN